MREGNCRLPQVGVVQCTYPVTPGMWGRSLSPSVTCCHNRYSLEFATFLYMYVQPRYLGEQLVLAIIRRWPLLSGGVKTRTI